YRTAIEELARGSGLSELELARRALQHAASADDAATESRGRDPGYYLIAAGRPAFEASIGFRPRLGTWPGRAVRTLGIGAYVWVGLAATALLLSVPLVGLLALGFGGPWLILLGS